MVAIVGGEVRCAADGYELMWRRTWPCVTCGVNLLDEMCRSTRRLAAWRGEHSEQQREQCSEQQEAGGLERCAMMLVPQGRSPSGDCGRRLLRSHALRLRSLWIRQGSDVLYRSRACSIIPSPTNNERGSGTNARIPRPNQVPPARLERTTNGLGNRCSIHLSYGGAYKHYS